MKTNPQKGAYPTWSDLLAILGIYLVAMLAFNLGGGLLLRFGIASQGPVVALVYALTFLSTICYALFAKRLRVGPDVKLLRFGFRKTVPGAGAMGSDYRPRHDAGHRTVAGALPKPVARMARRPDETGRMDDAYDRRRRADPRGDPVPGHPPGSR